MSETITKPTYHQTIDFESLMREARKHITALAGEVWTDHNSADPGITQLEVLAFCIADLSYRTSFDVKDIMTGYNGHLDTINDLPLADVALPNNPVTIKDLRKVLIDIDHPAFLEREIQIKADPTLGLDSYPTRLLVRNAFPIIAERTEVEFFAVSKNGRDSFLTFDTSYEYQTDKTVAQISEEEQILKNESIENVDDQINADEIAEKSPARPIEKMADDLQYSSVDEGVGAQAAQAANTQNSHTAIKYPIADLPSTTIITDYKNIDQIILNGLYSLQIEFEEDDFYQDQRFLRDLNQNYFEETIPLNGNDYTLSVLMPYWDDIKWALKDVDLLNATVKYDNRAGQDYFIAVDKLNYDDYFYDYYAELTINDTHGLKCYIKVVEDIQDVITVNGKDYAFTANFIDWNEISNGVERDYSGVNAADPDDHNLEQIPLSNGQFYKIKSVGIEGEPNTFDIQAKFKFNKIKTLLDDDGISFERIIPKQINLLTRIKFEEFTILQDESAIISALSAKYQDLFDQKIALEQAVHELLGKRENDIYANYIIKIKRVFEYLYVGNNSIWSNIGKFRNLGEDYSKFTASRVQEIALFGKLIVAPNYNVNEILADIYFRIDQFLSPLVKFNSLSEMTAKGYKFEDLFNGPLLNHGFIEDADLDNLKRRSVVYTSDMIRIIMDVPGVKAIEDFSISSYIDNRLMGRNVINCLSLTNSDIYKPRFSAEKTGLNVWVEDKNQEVIREDVVVRYKLKIQAAKNIQIALQDNGAIEIPIGRDMEIESYYSIQNDFPEVYGIGPYGLPADANAEGKGQAKQLKAFLLPFEQLLANYLKQIAHLPALFSYHRDIKSTYATQPLYDVPDVQPLIVGFKESVDTWDDFKANLDNAYQKDLDKGESNEEFLSRRSRFLSHLLSRFGESFEAYSTQMFDQHKALLNDPIDGISNYQTARHGTLEKLIENKIAFAEDYHKVSAQRYKAFDMTRDNRDRRNGIWNNNNIAAYKLRLCRLLGIERVNNESIFLADRNDDGELIDVEGMHIVEHILLRPRIKAARLMRLQNQPIENAQGSFIYGADKDPYSFRVTIVLPRYAGRFRQEDFRAFTEKLIRLETPAHVRIDFNWTGGACGKNFEQHYSAWKQNVYKMKPFIFQNIAEVAEINQDAIALDPTRTRNLKLLQESEKISKKVALKSVKSIANLEAIKQATNPDEALTIIGVLETNILTLQDQMIEALETPCELKLSLYNINDQIFTTTNGIITFEHNQTDVYNMRVSEIGGTITVYKQNVDDNSFQAVTEFKPITKTYFNIIDFLENSNGLTFNYGGKGRYKVEYAIEGRAPVLELIYVTKEIIQVAVQIGKRSPLLIEEMLDFNTETDGVFRISNQDWKSHFLKFDPENRPDNLAQIGRGYIESIANNLPPTLIADADGNPSYQIDFSTIYEQYGLGDFQITYELDGEQTFAAIELVLDLTINVFDQTAELLANADGIIEVSADIREIELRLDLPGGTLSVYDLDAVSIPYPAQNEPADEFFDDIPFGTVAWHKRIDALHINRDSDPIYQDGHHYRFVYEFGGETVRAVVLFKAPPIVVEKPTVKLFQKGKLLDQPYVLIADGTDNGYTIEYHPKDAEMKAWIINEDTEVILENAIVQTDYFQEEVETNEAYKLHGSQPIYVQVENAAGIAELDFIIEYKGKEPDPTNVRIRKVGDEKFISPIEKLYTLVFETGNEKQAFEFSFNNGDGQLLLIDEKGRETEVKVNGNRILFNGVNELPGGLKSGKYEAIYEPKIGDKIEFNLEVIHQMLAPLEIIDLSIKEAVKPLEKVYTLVYDYRNKEHTFQLNFGSGDGELVLEGKSGEKMAIPANGNEILLNGVDYLSKGIETGEYEAVYYTKKGETISFILNVINLNPTFILKDIQLEGANFLATAMPVDPDARTYIWRNNGNYFSRSKTPRLELIVEEGETIEIELTMHLQDFEAAFKMELSLDLINKLMDAEG